MPPRKKRATRSAQEAGSSEPTEGEVGETTISPSPPPRQHGEKATTPTLSVGMRVLHTVLDVTGVVVRFASEADFLHRGKILMNFAAIDRKVKVVKSRWCHPSELKAIRSSPTRSSKADVLSVERGAQSGASSDGSEPSQKSVRAKRAFEEALEYVEYEAEVAEVLKGAPELAAHERGRKLQQKSVNLDRSGSGTKWGVCGAHATKQTTVAISDRIKQFPNHSLVEAPSPSGKVLFCRCCPKTLQNIAGTIRTHVNSEAHTLKLKQWLKRQQSDNVVAKYLHEYFNEKPSEKDSSVDLELHLYRWRVLETCMKAGIPKAKVDGLRTLLERSGNALTSSTHLGSYVPKIEQFEFKRIQSEVAGQSVCLIFDGTCRFGDCTAVLLRWCTVSFEVEQRLIALRTVKKHLNGDNLGPFLIEIIGQTGLMLSSVVCTARDSCATNGKALSNIRFILNNAIHMMCISHTLSHCAEHVDLPVLRSFMTPWLSLVQHHPAAKSAWREAVGGSMKGFSNTRWLSREECCNEIAENYGLLSDFVEMLIEDEIGDAHAKKMRDIMSNNGDDLKVCVAARTCIGL